MTGRRFLLQLSTDHCAKKFDALVSKLYQSWCSDVLTVFQVGLDVWVLIYVYMYTYIYIYIYMYIYRR